MSDEPGSLFETLEPPGGGLAGLRSRIERDGIRRGRLHRLQAAGAVAAVLLVVAAVLLSPPGRRPDDPLADGLRQARLRLGLLEAPAEVLTIPADRRGVLAAERVPLDTDRVVFYLVASLEPEADPRDPAAAVD